MVTLYHASDSEDRASILAHGLDLRYGQRKFLPEDFDPELEKSARWDWERLDFQAWYPPGIYLFDSRAAAEDYGPWHYVVADVWRVDLSGLHLARDRDHDGRPSGKNPHSGYAFYTYDPVPPERLELISSRSGSWAFLCGLQDGPVPVDHPSEPSTAGVQVEAARA